MVIGLDILLPRVREGDLIKNLSPRELLNPEGAGFDLRVGELYELISPGYLGIRDRETADSKKLLSFSESEVKLAELESQKYYLVRTLESIKLDDDMLGIIHPRSTLFRSGVILQKGVCPPGYEGELVFGIYNAGTFNFKLEMGARIAYINILRIEGNSSPYRGQWQSGRVSTLGKEEQL